MRFFLGMIIFCAVCLSSCQKGEDRGAEASDILLQIGDSVLTLSAVNSHLSPELSSADSASLAHEVIDHWVEQQLLFTSAEKYIDDMDVIEAQVEEYRRSLIVARYRRMIVEGKMKEIPEDSVRRYYDRVKEDMRLTRPLVKGVYLKIPVGTDRLSRTRQWVMEATKESADKIEKYSLTNALEYDYFADRWVDWKSISDQIPTNFPNPDLFLKDNKEYETTINGSIYMLRVVDVMPSGEIMPYEFAAPIIREALWMEQQRTIGKDFVDKIYRKALKNGDVKLISYDPEQHKWVSKQ